MAQQTSKRGGIKLRRSTKHQGHYERQFFRTAGNKARRAARRLHRRDFWRENILKKNGKPVKGAGLT